MDSLERFVSAQARDYGTALAEIRSGYKRSHWMWYIFPQLQGLGNLRQATEELSKYRERGDKKHLHNAIGYFVIDIVFCLFSAVGVWITRLFYERAVWFTLLPLSILFIVFSIEKRRA